MKVEEAAHRATKYYAEGEIKKTGDKEVSGENAAMQHQMVV